VVRGLTLFEGTVVPPLRTKRRVGVLAEPGYVTGIGDKGVDCAWVVERVRRNVRRK
jgi:hypothetical protein